MTKKILISGSSSGLGLHIAEYLASRSYLIIGIGRRNLKDIKNGGDIFYDYSQLDVLSEQFESQIDSLISKHSDISILVNNLGRSEWKSILEVNNLFVEEMFKVNLKHFFLVTNKVYKKCSMLENIVNISSIAGRRGSKNNSVYSSMKFAINGITQSLSKELGEHGIRVNSVSPVLINTPGLIFALSQQDSPAFQNNVDEFMAKFAEENASLKRLPSAQDVANVVEFLISEKSAAITGQNINVDCGVFPQ